MADETAEEVFSAVAAERDAAYAANRERFEAQSWYEIDHRLALLLAPVARMGNDATVELTVVVDGAVISGSVVSAHAWAQRQNDQIRIGSPAVAAAFESLEPATDQLDRQSAEEGGASPQLKDQDRYIHFLGPVLLSGGVHVRMQATRVDLRKVSAWSIGRIPGE
jgi:hypothetical protein